MSSRVRRFSVLAAIGSLALLVACNKTGAEAPGQTGAPAASPDVTSAPAAPVDTVNGTVLETMNAGGYTYMKLRTVAKGDIWIAASQVTVAVGDKLTVLLEVPMRGFHSATLNRDFAEIYFVPAVAREGQALPQMAPAEASAPGGVGAPVTAHAELSQAAVTRVTPPQGGMSIAEVWARRTALAGKTVTVRGRVVKANAGILGRTWLHLQDGSGKAADETHDLTITTTATAAVGEIVTATGALSIDKDFGAGYAYRAIIEGATLTR